MPGTAHFQFTKILVKDLAAQYAFYSSVFDRMEKTRYERTEGNDPLEEILLTSTDGADQTIGLLHYLDRPVPVPGSAVIGFRVTGIEDVVRRAERAGGTVTEPVEEMPDLGIAVAFVEDPEGHVLELFEQR